MPSRQSSSGFETLPPKLGRRHVVILGAGASRAAFPNGDVNGHHVPLMNDLIETLDLENLLTDAGLDPTSDDFEGLYSRLKESGTHPTVVKEIEERTFDYFKHLELPGGPTLYDHLVLSLRPKDVIATFNWDPFLPQALSRNARFTKMPFVVYLHGNVAVGYCTKHKPISVDQPGEICWQCGSMLKQSPLLFPVRNKNYNDEPSIAAAWRILRVSMKEAFLFTIFGYRAPESDVEAINLMKDAWGDSNDRELEQVEIIDIRDKAELVESWKPFICRDHCHVRRSFKESMIAEHPRRSVEDLWEAMMQCNPQPDRCLQEDSDWVSVRRQYAALIEQEELFNQKKSDQEQSSVPR